MRDSRRQWIELGSGTFGGEEWCLIFAPEPLEPSDEHHRTSPTVALEIARKGASGRPPGLRWNSGPLGSPCLCVHSVDPPDAHVFGEVDYRFDRVTIHCRGEAVVDAAIVDCREYLPFNYYIAPVVSQVLRVTAAGPDGQSVSRDNRR